MPSHVAVIGLQYDSTDIQEWPFGIFLEIKRGLNEGPKVRGKDTTVPGLNYQLPRNRRAEYIEIELTGYVSGEGVDEEAMREDFATLRDVMKTLFDPTRDPALLIATIEDGTNLYVLARPENTAWNQVVPSMAAVSVELKAYGDWEPTT